MTGDSQCDGVLRAGLSDRSQRLRAAHAAGELRIGHGFSEGNRAKRIPDAALERRAANVEVEVKSIAWRGDELHDPGQLITERAVVQDNPAVRETRGQILFQFLGCRAKPDCANADRAARNKDFPQSADADCEFDIGGNADAVDWRGLSRSEIDGDHIHVSNSGSFVSPVTLRTRSLPLTPVLTFKL